MATKNVILIKVVNQGGNSETREISGTTPDAARNNLTSHIVTKLKPGEGVRIIGTGKVSGK